MPSTVQSSSSSCSSEATKKTEPVSSISDSSPEDQTVASSLLLLSGDKRVGEEVVVTNDGKSEEVIRNSFKCGTCDKSFRSYQALGGHRGSHKRIKSNKEELKVHECPVCFKVFASGQALGGHKSGSGHSAFAKHSKQSVNLFDLNLPAPPDAAAANDDKLKLV